VKKEETDRLPSKVLEIGPPLTEEDIDSYIRIRDAEDRSYKLRAIVDAWDKQQSEDRKMRKGYAWFFIILIAIQIIAINAFFLLVGLKIIKIDPLFLKVFFIPVLAEIVTMTLVILKYLFPKSGSDVLELIRKL